MDRQSKELMVDDNAERIERDWLRSLPGWFVPRSGPALGWMKAGDIEVAVYREITTVNGARVKHTKTRGDLRKLLDVLGVDCTEG